jgi:hypothetical protein
MKWRGGIPLNGKNGGISEKKWNETEKIQAIGLDFGSEK